MRTAYVETIKDITDLTRDTNLFIPKGSVLYVLEYCHNDIVIAEYGADNQVALFLDEYKCRYAPDWSC